MLTRGTPTNAAKNKQNTRLAGYLFRNSLLLFLLICAAQGSLSGLRQLLRHGWVAPPGRGV